MANLPDIYFEMINCLWDLGSGYDFLEGQAVTPEQTYMTLDPADFDPASVWFWEVDGQNVGTSLPYSVNLVDTDGTLYATITFDPQEPTDEFTRKRVSFTPPATAKTFAVQFPMGQGLATQDYEWIYYNKPTFATIRIGISSPDTASKAVIQFPLQCIGGVTGYGDGFFVADYLCNYMDYSVGGLDPLKTGWKPMVYTAIWHYSPDELATISRVVFEAAAGGYMAESWVNDFNMALFHIETNRMLPGSEMTWGEPDGETIYRQQVEIDPADLEAGHYELRYRCSNIQILSDIYEGLISSCANLMLWINPISKISIWQRVSKGGISPYTNWGIEDRVISDESRVLLSTPDGYAIHYEVSAILGKPVAGPSPT